MERDFDPCASGLQFATLRINTSSQGRDHVAVADRPGRQPGWWIGRIRTPSPEQTLLYQVVEEYHPAFEAQRAAEGKGLPDYVQREFEDYIKCGRLESGFLRVRCGSCHAERLVAFSCKRRGYAK